ncbi:hypothetical protein SAMN04487996_119154 [Dyadobacter soli]|uniref:Uncharacterized protein n=1 Tax=Dyadobacter soli TaxID=659014 RepID=A0A1G7UZ06_9BACT|nr:hypothetical protein [Dyadobacter soli]SDG52704.1 hypothetical protein SAMN04487996_119154 [Dyadobacter soli]
MNPNDQDDELYDDDLPGNYPADEDVFRQGLIDSEIDPEDVSHTKRPIDIDADDWNEKSFEDDLTGDDLDVPGSEYDDEDEEIGREDEENNYYSLGGDNHESQEENQGD